MSNRSSISTPNAPEAIGTYSQAVKVGNTVYLSGQIPLVPETMEVIEGGVEAQFEQAFKNLQAVIEAAGGTTSDVVKLNIYLTDLGNFAKVNETMARYFSEPYPARAAVGVSQLPKDVEIEIEGVMVIAD